ncbi:acyltransferase family protein [Microbacterium sp. SLBN-154]|uniref:acyltransferase family protein n=1 Tax=Microbacterium sp. SLBN-154 TaxID=2768458 RepID=UPI001F1B5BA6|nr:acyltransferase family protein [Microbacterium sp. SLBN-154]
MTAETTTSGTARTAARPASERRFRSDVQALRALAIGAVVLNHLWPGAIGGGYVGVDVFFVISGFLITSHLLREVTATRRIRLGAFYARRIRRLLPAALLVLVVSAVLVAAFLPYPQWERSAFEVAASALYVENWYLTAMATDYSALNDSATVAQHYWSLSVEEQFYFVWPVLVVAAAAFGVRFVRGSRHGVGIMLVSVGITSLAASIIVTEVWPAQAYFVTYGRMWEFVAGGLVALLAGRWRMPRALAGAISAAGLAMILIAILLYGPDTAFPGWAALLPVAGTAAVIAAGTGHPRLWHTPLTASRPVQWVGEISYSLYLWHWPLIVVAPFVILGELNALVRLGILAVALVLAWITKVLVEDPGQRWRWWTGSVRRSVLAMAGGVAVGVIVSAGLLLGFQARAAADDPTAPLPFGSCVGPAALAPEIECDDPFGPATTSVVMTRANEYFYTPSECEETTRGPLSTTQCDFSGGDPTARVWLVGDSHAQQWQGAVFDLARERRWDVTVSYRGGCPPADVAFIGFRIPWSTVDIDQCRQWARDVSDEIAAATPDAVFTSMAARLHLVDDGSGRPVTDQFADGLQRDWERWIDAGVHVVALADPPFNGEVRSPDCVVLNRDAPIECARLRVDAQPADPVAIAGERMDSPSLDLVDLTDRFCDATLCYGVIGGIPVYFDADHLNLQYVRMLAPEIAAVIDDAPWVGGEAP